MNSMDMDTRTQTKKEPRTARPRAPRLPAQLRKAIAAAQDRKADELVVLDLRPAHGFADFFLIGSGYNPRQIKAIADAIQASLGPDVKPAHVEGYDRAGWILLDYFDFIVHVFSPETRAFYDLERLWGNAQRIDIPDEEQPSSKK
jgi:ribosome-associated protein